MKNRPIKILIAEPEYFTETSIRRMSRVGQVVAKRMTRRELLRQVHKFNALIVRIETKVDKSLIDKAKNLECAVSATTGTNHIDTKYLALKNIPLFRLSGTHSIPTAEHAIAILLSAARKIPFAHRDMEKGIWRRWEHLGTQIEGKTLGIIGIGRIGSHVAKKAKSLGLEVIAYDPYLSKSKIKSRSARKVDIETLLRRSDFISIHTPLTAETQNMIDAREFKKMKASVILINTARAAIVNQKALLQAIKNSKIAIAALDVHREEPISQNNLLSKYAKVNRNLILTPHLGASTKEAVEESALYSANVVTGFFRSKKRRRT